MGENRFNILVLDDDEDDAFLICEAISEIEGSTYDVTTTHTPDMAMEAIYKESFHAVLCDYRLGATSGIDFINNVRSKGYDMPIILLTGMENSSTDKEALEAGAADFLNKSNLSALVVDRAIRYAIASADRQRLLSTVLSSVEAAVCVLDHDKVPLLWNPSFTDLARTQGCAEESDAIKSFASRLLTVETVHTVGERILEKKFSSLPDEGSVITLHDVTEHIEALKERERAENRAAHLAKHCSLTGLPNRIAFADRIAKEIQKSDDDGTGFFLLNLDLNKFKEINDVYGHNVGDLLLKEVSARFSSCLGECDYLARLGGDEFVAIQRRSEDGKEVPGLADRLVKSTEGTFAIDGFFVRTGVSIGVASYPQHGATAEELLSNADIAMYRAKVDQKCRVHPYNMELDQVIRERRLIAAELKEAVENEALDVYFQPQANVQTGQISGFEALARWEHPKRGMISPEIFIPIAEENGLINHIGQSIMKKSCEFARDWPDDISVSVNISALQIRYTDLVSSVKMILYETGLPAKKLELEVTESILIDDFDYALHVLRGLKNIGVSLAMDDFGTGYSSLTSIVEFPFDKLKIDRSFIMHLDKKSKISTIAKAMIGLGKNLGLKMIAEGVETAKHVEFLKTQGCEEMQGYYLGEAMKHDRVLPFIEEYHRDKMFDEGFEKKIQLPAA